MNIETTVSSDSNSLSYDIAFDTSLSSATTATATSSVSLLLLPENLDNDEFSNSDATISCATSNRHVSVNRAFLAARSPFFKSLFAAKTETNSSMIVKVEMKELTTDFDVSFDSLVSVLAYMYNGEVREAPKGVRTCVDDECSHVSCKPAVDFLVEVLYLSHTFHIPQLLSVYQRHLIEVLDKVELDDLLPVLYVADICANACNELLGKCIDIIVRPGIDVTNLEKSLPQHIVQQIIDTRKEFGLFGADYVLGPHKHVKMIHRALESDDVELVRMLLKEGHTTLDDAFALHFAVAHCDYKTTTELLDLGLADVNLRNQRGFTVLHVAAMRKAPVIIVSLLTKGAQPLEVTQDNRNALQIAKRQTKASDFLKSTEGKSPPEDRLCIEILEQAVMREPLIGDASVYLAKAGDDLRMKVLYLENRVALARLLFSMEAKVAMDIAQLDGTSEFTLSKDMAEARRNSVDLNKAPFILTDEHLRRMKSLSKTVELGKRFFPRCSDVLNQIMEPEDLSQIAFLENDTPEEQLRKRKRYADLQDALTKAFTEDKQDFDRSTLPSSSSSTAIGNPDDIRSISSGK